MCGRFSLGVDTDRLVAEFGLVEVTTSHAPRYNIAPTQPVPAVVRAPGGLRLGSLAWGLAGSAPRAGRRPLINARAETVDRLPSFSTAFRRRRCWVIADGFYEWRRDPDDGRTPYHIALPDGRPFAFAGLWSPGDGEGETPSCAIITTRPAAAIAHIHDRMPVILTPEHREAWIDPAANAAGLLDLLAPYAGPLVAYPVSTRVNSVANDDQACRRPEGPPTLPLPETSRR